MLKSLLPPQAHDHSLLMYILKNYLFFLFPCHCFLIFFNAVHQAEPPLWKTTNKEHPGVEIPDIKRSPTTLKIHLGWKLLLPPAFAIIKLRVSTPSSGQMLQNGVKKTTKYSQILVIFSTIVWKECWLSNYIFLSPWGWIF